MEESCLEQVIFDLFNDPANFDKNIKEVADCIVTRKKYKVVDFIEGLGPSLTHTNVEHRVSAMELLSGLLSSLPNEFLNESELTFLVDFLFNRLKDQHVVIPKVISCVHSIVQCTHLKYGERSRLIKEIMKEITIQSHVHPVRRKFFTTLNYLLTMHSEEMKKELEEDFVMEYLHAIDAERDPRNLVYVFKNTPLVLSLYNLGPFAEDFFESLACYFPVDFNPTISVPTEQKVTREDLVSSLEKCLSFTNAFAEWVFPLAFEKLGSSSTEAKKDSLSLLRACCETCYLPQDIQPHLHGLWHAIRREVMMGGDGDPSISQSSLKLVTSVHKVISGDDEILNECLDTVLSELTHHFSDPDLSLIEPISKILVAMCDANEKVCSSVLKHVYPDLQRNMEMKESHHARRSLLSTLLSLIKSSLPFSEITLTRMLGEDLERLKSFLFTLLSSDEPSLVALALNAFVLVMEKKSDFQETDASIVCEHVFSLLKSSVCKHNEVRLNLIELMKEIGGKYPMLYEKTVVPKLLSGLRDHGQRLEGTGDYMYREIIGETCGMKKGSYNQVMNEFVAVLKSSGSVEGLKLVILEAIGRMVIVSREGGCEESECFVRDIVDEFGIVDVVLSMCRKVCEVSDGKGESGDNDVIEKCSRLLRIISCSVGVEQQIKLVDKYWRPIVEKGLENEETFEEVMRCGWIRVLEAIFVPMKTSVVFEAEDELMCHLLNISCGVSNGENYSWDDEEMLSACRWMAVVLNKKYSKGQKPSKFSSQVEKLLQGIETHEVFNCRAQQVVKSLSWIMKAVVMSGWEEFDDIYSQWIKLLETSESSDSMVDGFQIVMMDDDKALNEASDCSIRIFYKQRIFSKTIPHIIELYRNSKSEEIQRCCIRIMTVLLNSVPVPVILLSIDKVLHLIVASLIQFSTEEDDRGKSGILQSCLNTLIVILDSKEGAIITRLKEYISDVIPALLKVSCYKPSMEVRRLSLKCLQRFGKFPVEQILPFKKQVVQGTCKILDDPKRLVRVETRKTRSQWILVAAPGGF